MSTNRTQLTAEAISKIVDGMPGGIDSIHRSKHMNTNDYFNPDASPIRCTKCNSTNFTEKLIGVVDVFQGMGPACEAEYFCQCGECVGFWAYGSWHPQYLDAFLESRTQATASN